MLRLTMKPSVVHRIPSAFLLSLPREETGSKLLKIGWKKIPKRDDTKEEATTVILLVTREKEVMFPSTSEDLSKTSVKISTRILKSEKKYVRTSETASTTL